MWIEFFVQLIHSASFYLSTRTVDKFLDMFFSCLGKKRTKRIPFKGDFLQAVPLEKPPPDNQANLPYQGEDVPIFALPRLDLPITWSLSE